MISLLFVSSFLPAFVVKDDFSVATQPPDVVPSTERSGRARVLGPSYTEVTWPSYSPTTGSSFSPATGTSYSPATGPSYSPSTRPSYSPRSGTGERDDSPRSEQQAKLVTPRGWYGSPSSKVVTGVSPPAPREDTQSENPGAKRSGLPRPTKSVPAPVKPARPSLYNPTQSMQFTVATSDAQQTDSLTKPKIPPKPKVGVSPKV